MRGLSPGGESGDGSPAAAQSVGGSNTWRSYSSQPAWNQTSFCCSCCASRRRLLDEVAERDLVGLKLVSREVKRDREPLRRSVREEGCSNADEPVRRHRHLARKQPLADRDGQQ